SSQDIATALKNLRVSTVSANIKPPTWDLKKKSVATYLKEMKNYFDSINIIESEYLGHLKTILPEELKIWFEHDLPNIDSWETFKTKFTNRFEDWHDQEERKKLLA